MNKESVQSSKSLLFQLLFWELGKTESVGEEDIAELKDLLALCLQNTNETHAALKIYANPNACPL